jgi:D-alanine-D-alanine ligase
MKKRIGLVYDLRTDYLSAGFTEAEVAEFDTESTIDSLHQTIESLGYHVERVGNGWALCRALAAGKRWDLVFTIAEGLAGRSREAQVPALLELYQIPYTFSDPLICAATLDKAVAKKLVAFEGLATAPFAVVRSPEEIGTVRLRYPLFAKPLAEGTGKGIDRNSMVEHPGQLEPLCRFLLEQYRQPVLVEEYLPGREFTVGILGTGSKARVIGTMEIEVVNQEEPPIYSYVNKEECETRIRYSALREGALKESVETLALRCYQVLECRDAGRVDIRCDADNQPYFLEVNPLAGLHPTHSDLPMIAAQEGMSYADLIATILQSAFDRAREEQKIHGRRSCII